MTNVRAKSFQLCPTLCYPLDCSPQGSSVHGDSPGKNTGMGCHALLQGIFPTQGLIPGLPNCTLILYHLSYQGGPRILEWVAYPFSRGSPRPRNRSRVSCIAGGYISGRLECYLIVWMYQIYPFTFSGTSWLLSHFGNCKKL